MEKIQFHGFNVSHLICLIQINDNAQNKVVIIMEARQGHYNWIDMGSNNELQSSYNSDKIDIRPKKVYGEQRYSCFIIYYNVVYTEQKV